ncbi:protein phosphatase 1D-like [Dysidea avara]|uniref:protein phosphatase 1D-like n=1 Tax=Dysidea avara TaxID=196820 RepID=UPI00331D9734
MQLQCGFCWTDLWKKTKYGEPSTAGTTVACAIIESYRIFIANVGDSTVVLGKSNLNDREPKILAEIITRDHKPGDEEERRRIEALGGSVLNMRVVWERKMVVTTSMTEVYQVHQIPFHNVARRLGDLWSVTENNEYLVSPIPDIYVHYFDWTKDKFLILASDGLWNMLNPQTAVNIVHSLCKDGIKNAAEAGKVASALVDKALYEWDKRNLTADNISVLIVFF